MILKKSVLFIVFIFIIITQSSSAQENRFQTGFVAGVNFAELEGEGLLDYFGLNTGIFATTKLSNRFQLGVELLFSQNGEYILPASYPAVDYGAIWLNHLEIPIHIDYLISIVKKEKNQLLNLNLGFAFAQLLSYSAEDANKNEITDQLIYEGKTAFQIQAGLIYQITPRIAFNLKSSFPISSNELDLTIATRVFYTINPPRLKNLH